MPTRPRTLPDLLLARLTAGDASAIPKAAELLAIAAGAKSAPRKSLAKALQHMARAGVSAPTLRQLEADVLCQLPAPRATSGTEGTCGTAETAVLVGIPPERFVKLLHEPHYRRLFGWPLWTGYEWRFVLAAVDPATSRAHLTTVPELEPAPIAATLPPWCRREVPPLTGRSEGSPCSTGDSEPAVSPLRTIVRPAST